MTDDERALLELVAEILIANTSLTLFDQHNALKALVGKVKRGGG